MNKQIYDFLLSKGYKYENPAKLSGYDDYVKAVYFYTPQNKDLPLCLCNEKPPQLCIEEHFSFCGCFNRFTIGIVNQAPQGWIDFKYYSLSESDILERYDEITNALFSAWRALFKE